MVDLSKKDIARTCLTTKRVTTRNRARHMHAEDQTQERRGVGRTYFLDTELPSSFSFAYHCARLRVDQKYRGRILSHKISYGI